MRTKALFLAAGFACACGACGSSDGGGGAGPAGGGTPVSATGPDVATFDVKWKADTVLLADSDAATVDPQSSGGGMLHFVNASPAVKALTPGRLVLVPTIGLYRVKTVTPSGNDVTLATDDASLVDAAESGHVTWDVGAHHVGKSSLSVIGPQTLRTLDSPTVSFSGTIGNFNASVELTPAGDRTNVMLSAEHTPFAGRSKAQIDGFVQAFRSQGDFQFGGGAIQAFTYGIRGYHADLTVTYDFAAIQGSADVNVPVSMTWPFLVGPIPMYVSLSANVSLQSTLTAQNDAANGSIHFTYGGDFGVLRNGASFMGSGGLADITADTSGAQHAAQITSGVEALFEAPKISLGVGTPSAADVFGANLWFKVKSEVISNLTIPNPFAQGKPSCLQVSGGVGAYYGGAINFFGVSIAQEQTISAANRVLAQSGMACQ